MPRILIVDDEPGIRFGVRDFLESEGFEADEADSVATAERAVREVCQAQGTNQPRLEWGSETDVPQRLRILIEDLDPIEVEFDMPSLRAQGGIAAARVARRALVAVLRSR